MLHHSHARPPSYASTAFPGHPSEPYTSFTTTAGFIPCYLAQSQPDNSSLYNTEPRRPPSPAPSYHAVAPSNHATLLPDSIPPNHTASQSDTLARAMRDTPNVILSHLTISNHSGSSHRPMTDRHLSATTTDGKERYHVTFPSMAEMKVLRTNSAGGQSIIGLVGINPRGLRIQFVGNDGRRDRQEVVCEFDDLQKKQRLPLDLYVDGYKKRFQWEIVSEDTAQECESDVTRRQSQQGQRQNERPVFGLKSRKERQIEDFVGLRLVDVEGLVWAGYIHGMNRKRAEETNTWGEVEIKGRAALLDEGVDKAFVGMISLVEVYVRLFGKDRQKGGLEGIGALAGVLFCCVM